MRGLFECVQIEKESLGFFKNLCLAHSKEHKSGPFLPDQNVFGFLGQFRPKKFDTGGSTICNLASKKTTLAALQKIVREIK